MPHQYGKVITVLDPTGHPVKAQIGEDTPEGPIIHIHAFQIEAPANTLRQEGWKIEGEAAPAFAAEASEIVDALLNDEEQEIARHTAATGPRTLGQAGPGAFLPQRAATPTGTQGKTIQLPYGSGRVNAEMHGSVAVFRGDHGMWIARNLRTQRASSNYNKEAAIRDVAY